MPVLVYFTDCRSRRFSSRLDMRSVRKIDQYHAAVLFSLIKLDAKFLRQRVNREAGTYVFFMNQQAAFIAFPGLTKTDYVHSPS